MREKRIVLVAHDSKKRSMVEWVAYNKEISLPVNLLLSGPLGGDAQVGAMTAEGRADVIIFFWDPLTPQPHDVDVKTLLRLAVLCDVPIACNRSTADFLISSSLNRDWKRYIDERKRSRPSQVA